MNESGNRKPMVFGLASTAVLVTALFLFPVVGRYCGVPLPVTHPLVSTPGTNAAPGPVLTTVAISTSPLTSPLPGPGVSPSPDETIPVYTYHVIQTYPHDPDAFTQGLVFHEGVLYEGTGLYGHSSLRKVTLDTGKVVQFHALPETFFGEGITLLGDRLYQLTWKEHKGFVYDRQTFDLLAEFSYPTEGWGLTHDGTYLIMSDGTHVLHFLDPQDLSEVRQVEVRDANGPVQLLNELEYVRGEVYANIWRTDRIARIDPASGMVVGWIDLQGLLPAEDRTRPVDVLNGIAYDAEGERLFVTGKLWPKLFEIELVPRQE